MEPRLVGTSCKVREQEVSNKLQVSDKACHYSIFRINEWTGDAAAHNGS